MHLLTLSISPICTRPTVEGCVQGFVIERFCFPCGVHFEFFHLIYWRYISNVILVQISQDFRSLLVFHCIFVKVVLR